MPTIKLLRRREVESITGLSRATIYDEMNEGRFPKPIRIGQRAVAWIDSEIAEWQDKRIAERDQQAAA